MRFLILASCALVLACSGTSLPDGGSDSGLGDAGPPPPPPQVDTGVGEVIGVRGTGSLAFLGIPYAAPPIGALRFAPPTPAAPWTAPLTSHRPARCVQDQLGLALPSDEDCLYLNVHTPDPMPEGAPVMVWIHGGGYIFGEGLQTDGGTAGDLLASEHGVVVVSMNYRLGPFGFLALPALSAEQDGASGNYGLMDQRLALEWVRDHIAAFGGDPNNVTLFGESAGGNSVCAHLVSPASRGLFHHAIVESGLCDDPVQVDLAAAEITGTELATELECEGDDVAACMRAIDAATLLEHATAGADAFTQITQRLSWWPIVDGVVLPERFVEAARGGRLADVPTIMGWNADEGTLFVFLAEQGGLEVTAASYDEVVTAMAAQYGIEESAIRAQYPLASYNDPGAAAAAIIGHANLACPSRRAARAMAEADLDIRVYRFSYPDAQFQLPATRTLGAFHSAEVQYVFGHPSALGRPRFTGDDLTLHEAMSARFTELADDTLSSTVWPPNEAASDTHLVFDHTVEIATDADADVCALWEPGG